MDTLITRETNVPLDALVASVALDALDTLVTSKTLLALDTLIALVAGVTLDTVITLNSLGALWDTEVKDSVIDRTRISHQGIRACK